MKNLSTNIFNNDNSIFETLIISLDEKDKIYDDEGKLTYNEKLNENASNEKESSIKFILLKSMLEKFNIVNIRKSKLL